MESRARLAARVAEIAPFHVMEVQTAARVLEAAGRTVIHMEIGEPDFPTPAPVLAEAQRAIAQGGIYYTSALGLPELREAIAVHYADHYGVAVDAERVIVTAGSSAALLLVNALLVNRDDRILLADPGYPCTRHFIRILEGEPVGIPVGPAPKHHVRNLEKLAQNLYISPPTPSQRAALACFRPDTLAIVEERRQAFRARRDLLVPALRELGFGIPVTPDGGFFVYADCSRFCADSERFCRDVLEGAGVAVTPGIDFGRHRANAHVRFAYTIGQAKIEEGIARLARFLGHS